MLHVSAGYCRDKIVLKADHFSLQYKTDEIGLLFRTKTYIKDKIKKAMLDPSDQQHQLSDSEKIMRLISTKIK